MESIKNIYNKISKEFNNTRFSVWSGVKKFLDSLPENTTILEIGCGNGKNMLYRKDLFFTGIDISKEQVNICLDKLLNVYEEDMCSLSFNDNMFDNMICIATYHHLDNDDDRQLALDEMYRCLKQNGLLLLTVLAMEQPISSKFTFTKSDEFIPWSNLGLRYYHIYRKGELEEEIKRLCPEFKIISCDYELGNWNIILKK